MKIISALVSSAIFFAFLIIIYYIHARFFSVDVVFYSALGDAAVAALLAGLLLARLTIFQSLGRFEKLQLILIWLLAGYALAISVPTVIDRSLSLYILEKLQQRGGGIKKDSFARIFTDEFINEHRLVDVRLTEQLASGTIKIENGCVLLTEKGQRVASFGRYFRGYWLPKHRLLSGEYTDVLTDPFRSSSDIPDYVCK